MQFYIIRQFRTPSVQAVAVSSLRSYSPRGMVRSLFPRRSASMDHRDKRLTLILINIPWRHWSLGGLALRVSPIDPSASSIGIVPVEEVVRGQAHRFNRGAWFVSLALRSCPDVDRRPWIAHTYVWSPISARRSTSNANECVAPWWRTSVGVHRSQRPSIFCLRSSLDAPPAPRDRGVAWDTGTSINHQRLRIIDELHRHRGIPVSSSLFLELWSSNGMQKNFGICLIGRGILSIQNDLDRQRINKLLIFEFL